METVEDGKGYSKRRRLFGTLEEVADYLSDKDTGWIAYAESICSASYSAMEKFSIPEQGVVFGWAWEVGKHINGDEGSALTVVQPGGFADYVEGMGYARDSKQELAARIADHAACALQFAEQGFHDGAIRHAIALGQAVTLYRVYEIGRSGNATRKRRALPWPAIAGKLRSDLPNTKSRNDVWESIPESTSPDTIEGVDGDIEFYRDGDKLFASVDGENERSLSRARFFKDYFKVRTVTP